MKKNSHKSSKKFSYKIIFLESFPNIFFIFVPASFSNSLLYSMHFLKNFYDIEIFCFSRREKCTKVCPPHSFFFLVLLILFSVWALRKLCCTFYVMAQSSGKEQEETIKNLVVRSFCFSFKHFCDGVCRTGSRYFRRTFDALWSQFATETACINFQQLLFIKCYFITFEHSELVSLSCFANAAQTKKNFSFKFYDWKLFTLRLYSSFPSEALKSFSKLNSQLEGSFQVAPTFSCWYFSTPNIIKKVPQPLDIHLCISRVQEIHFLCSELRSLELQVNFLHTNFIPISLTNVGKKT